MEILFMEEKHWQEVAEIYQQGIDSNLSTFESQCPTYEYWHKNHLEKGQFVATIDGKVVGFVSLSQVSYRVAYRGVCEVSVYVHKDFRQKGIGKALLDYIWQWSDVNGIWTLESYIFEENEASIQLHERCGFRVVGHRDKIGMDKFGLWRNTIIMERRSRKIGFEGCDMANCKMKHHFN